MRNWPFKLVFLQMPLISKRNRVIEQVREFQISKRDVLTEKRTVFATPSMNPFLE